MARRARSSAGQSSRLIIGRSQVRALAGPLRAENGLTARGALRGWRTAQKRERLAVAAEYEDWGFVFATPFGALLNGSNLLHRDFNQTIARPGLRAVGGT